MGTHIQMPAPDDPPEYKDTCHMCTSNCCHLYETRLAAQPRRTSLKLSRLPALVDSVLGWQIHLRRHLHANQTHAWSEV